MTIYIRNRDSSASRRGATPLALGPADSVNSFLSCSGLGKQLGLGLGLGLGLVRVRVRVSLTQDEFQMTTLHTLMCISPDYFTHLDVYLT